MTSTRSSESESHRCGKLPFSLIWRCYYSHPTLQQLPPASRQNPPPAKRWGLTKAQMMLAFLTMKYFLIKQYTVSVFLLCCLFRHNYCTLKLQSSVNISFICTGKPKNLCDSFYCDIWKPKNSWYSLYCDSLEPNPPYLWGIPAFKRTTYGNRGDSLFLFAIFIFFHVKMLFTCYMSHSRLHYAA